MLLRGHFGSDRGALPRAWVREERRDSRWEFELLPVAAFRHGHWKKEMSGRPDAMRKRGGDEDRRREGRCV